VTNAPATFQIVIDIVLAHLNGKCFLIYLDDIIVFAPSLQEHMTDLGQIFEKLSKARL